MRRLIYDVAMSLDGFIAGPSHDASGFLFQGDHVDAYFERLQTYTHCVMGKGTYEAGYSWGIKPGVNPYPHLDVHVCSNSIELPPDSAVKIARGDAVDFVRNLKETGRGDIYLCGGGAFAGAMLRAGLIDTLLLKLNPVVLGAGVTLFGNDRFDPAGRFRLTETHQYESGVVLLTYEHHYSG
jgi:dihydrofolate reductase